MLNLKKDQNLTNILKQVKKIEIKIEIQVNVFFLKVYFYLLKIKRLKLSPIPMNR
jgi:hypothetical protein